MRGPNGCATLGLMGIAALVAVLLFALVPAPALAEPPGGKTPAYIIGENAGLHVAANRDWLVKQRPARQTARLGNGVGPSADPAWHIWASKCLRHRQTVRFTRDVWLPGPPRPLGKGGDGLKFNLGTYDPVARDFERFEVRMNGTVAARATRRTLFSKDHFLDVRLLHYGWNSLAVTVVKKAGPCRSWDPRRLRWVAYRGVTFAFTNGRFEADLQVGQGGSSIAYSKTHRIRLAINMRNAGAAEARHVYFKFTMDPHPAQVIGAGQVMLADYSSEGEVSGCVDTPGDPTFIAVECNWTDFGPGESGAVIVDLVFLERNASFYRWELEMGWQIDVSAGDPRALKIEDPDGRNNARAGIKHVFCGPLDTAPECVNAL